MLQKPEDLNLIPGTYENWDAIVSFCNLHTPVARWVTGDSKLVGN